MQVIVVGAGEVGSYIAERLSGENHDVVIIDVDVVRVNSLRESLDVQAMVGSGTNPDVLAAANVASCDLLVAVTSNDEVNLVSSLLAKSIGVPRTIVRIEAAALRGPDAEKVRAASGADLVIDPDAETAEEVLELVDFPGADEVHRMAGGEVVVLGARLPEHAPLVGRSLESIAAEFEPEWEFMVGAIGRGGETVIPRREFTLEAGDHLRVVAKTRARRLITELLGLDKGVTRKVMLLGGGRTAERLAVSLVDRGVQVVIVERDHERAWQLAEELDEVTVLEGEITDADLLAEADVGKYQVVVALTGEDDANILACLYAKSSGARETIAVVHRLALLDLLGEVGIDVALSPRTATANGVLRFVRGDVAAVATFLQGEAEVIELEVAPNSPADGACVQELGLPKDVLIGAIVRDGKAQIGRGKSRLRGRDHVVAFAMPGAVDEVRRIFG